MTEEEVNFIYDDDEDEDDTMIMYENNGGVGINSTQDDLVSISKSKSLVSQSSEFDIDEDYSGDDLEYDELLSVPITHENKKSLNNGSVPNLQYECLTTQDIFQKMLNRVHHIQPILAIPTEDILTLLQHFDWNEERLLEAWTDRMDELLLEVGIHMDENKSSKCREIILKEDFYA